jgi:type I restriction enzyme S subunit
MSNLGDILSQPICLPTCIPCDWSWINLIDVSKPKQWKTIASADMSEYGFPVFGANGFIGFYSEYNHEFETIAITCRGNTCGTINKIPAYTYVTGNSMALDDIDEAVVAKDFLYYALIYRQVTDSISGSAQPQITRDGLQRIQFPAPPLPEQQKIAATLTAVDEVIESTQAQINKLKDLKAGMMQELLTKGIGHTEFEDSPLGKMPKNWQVKLVFDIQKPGKYNCVGGPFGSDLTSKDYIKFPGVPVIRGTNLSTGIEKFKDFGFVYVSDEKAESLVRNMAYRGDLIFTQRGTMGQVGLVPKNSRFIRYIISQSQMKLTPNSEIINEEYIYQFFTSNLFIRQLEMETIATGLPHINLGILKSFNVPIPSIDEQEKISTILSSLDARISLAIQKGEQFQATKKALMQDLLTGKVRVKITPHESPTQTILRS